MAETDQATTEGAGAAQGGPQLRVITQYVRDLSFESPNVPQSLAPQDESPQIGVNVDVGVNSLSETDFEVVLKLNVDAKVGGKQLFLTELEYAGVFRVANIPQESLQAVLLIECPRLIFPFARRIIGDITRDGGFPPLMIDPIDFAALFRQQMQAQQEAASKDHPDA
ncbi:MAG: protein-export chaperone SecB [Parvibaculaceae bacterium]